jgi:hypothetical protein
MRRESFSPARGFLLGLAMVLVCGMLSPAVARPITFTFTGRVDSVDPGLEGTFSPGETLTGSYTFESTTAARAGSNGTFAFFDALTALNFHIGSYSASSSAAPEIQVDNDPGGGAQDRYAVLSRVSDGLTGPSVAGNPLLSFMFRLDDSTNTVFSGALILPTSLSLSSFDEAPPSRQFFVFFGDPANPSIVTGTITGLSPASVPEPGTGLSPAAVPEPGSMALRLFGVAGVVLALCLFGVAGVVTWRRRVRAK